MLGKVKAIDSEKKEQGKILQQFAIQVENLVCQRVLF